MSNYAALRDIKGAERLRYTHWWMIISVVYVYYTNICSRMYGRIWMWGWKCGIWRRALGVVRDVGFGSGGGGCTGCCHGVMIVVFMPSPELLITLISMQMVVVLMAILAIWLVVKVKYLDQRWEKK